MSEPRPESYSASVRLSLKGGPQDRAAKEAFERLIELPDPADPARKFTAQRLLIESILAYDREITKQAEVAEAPDRFDTLVIQIRDAFETIQASDVITEKLILLETTLKEEVRENIHSTYDLLNGTLEEIRAATGRLEQRIDTLVRNGILSKAQGTAVLGEVQSELNADSDFAAHLAASFKPGRRSQKRE